VIERQIDLLVERGVWARPERDDAQ
jgi:hypothetical protein